MTIEEGAKYVAAAYAIIMAVLIIYYFMSARRVATLQRDVELLEDEAKRAGAGGRDRHGVTSPVRDRRRRAEPSRWSTPPSSSSGSRTCCTRPRSPCS